MEKGAKIRFYLVNYLFPKLYDELKFEIRDVPLIYKKDSNYNSKQQILKESYGIETTAYIDLTILEDEATTVSFVRRLNFLFSFCRGNIINYSKYIVLNENEDEIKSCSIDPISTRYTSLELIPKEYIQETQNFLSKAFELYDIIDESYMIRKIAREYPTTRNSATFLSSRSLILVAIIEHILFCYNNKIKNLDLLDADSYIEILEKIKNDFYNLLQDKFGVKYKSRITLIVNKMNSLNQRTLNWKFEKFIHEYKIPLNSEDIKRFKDIRDSLAHTLDFPQNEENIKCWKFLINVIDKIIMGLFCYEGNYYNFYSNKIDYFKLTS